MHTSLLSASPCAVGISRAERVDQAAIDIYNKWLAEDRCGDMAFAKRNIEVREDPRLLLDGCEWVISCAFSYYSGKHHPFIADYALVRDYHLEIRERLGQAAKQLEAEYGCSTRVCVDSAPIRERYWAQRAGIGFIGLNNQLIVPGVGSRVVLGEILVAPSPDFPFPWQEWSAEAFRQEKPIDDVQNNACLQCGRCVAACPLGSLDGAGGMDCRKCISYLTIEARTSALSAESCSAEGSEDSLLSRIGCDICQRVCPHNQTEPPLSPFPINTPLLTLTREQLSSMSQGAWRRLTAESPLSRLRRKPIL